MLIVQELIKNTPEDHPDRQSLERALEEMQVTTELIQGVVFDFFSD